MRLSKLKLSIALATGALVCAAVPAAAGATVVNLSQNEGGGGISFSALSPAFSPGDVYPSTITAPAGTVNDVNVNLQESHQNPDDLDVELVSPNGTVVFLMSDACGADAEFQTLKFDDDAVLLLSDPGPCTQASTYDPSNYEAGADIYSFPAPADVALNDLAFFEGGPSGGAWRLFAMDDTNGNGGQITNWSMTLDYTPTPVTTPLVTPGPIAGPTGQRSAALKKCAKIKNKKKKKKCKKRARLLPV